jgi:hypothetical protein
MQGHVPQAVQYALMQCAMMRIVSRLFLNFVSRFSTWAWTMLSRADVSPSTLSIELTIFGATRAQGARLGRCEPITVVGAGISDPPSHASLTRVTTGAWGFFLALALALADTADD